VWLGHFIEHLMCIGGELEHHKALPRPGKKIDHSTALLAGKGGVYIGFSLVPVSGWNRY
jgi:hypothetical protein